MLINVLHIINDMGRNGGAQKIVFDLAKRAPKNFTIRILTLYSINEYSKELDYENIECKSIRELGVSELFRWRSWADVVHSHLFPSAYIALLFSGPKIQTEHNSHNRRRDNTLFYPFEKFMYSRYSSNVSISQEVENCTASYLGNKPVNSIIIFNGVDVGSYRCDDKRDRVGTPFRIGMVGRLHPYKDQATILRAVARLELDIEIDFAGDGSEKEHLLELSRKLGLEARVKFLGVISDVPGFLSKLDVYIQSSKVEGFGLAVVEAMASGLPVFGTNVPGLNEVIIDEAYMFEVGDAVRLASLLSTIHHDSNFFVKACDHSAKRAGVYGIDSFSDSYYAEYERVYSNGL